MVPRADDAEGGGGLLDRRVRAARAAAGEAAPAEGRRDRPVADVRLRRPAHAPVAVRSTGPRTAGSGRCARAGTSSSRPSSGYGKVFVEPAEGRLLRRRREDRRVALAAEVPVLLGRVARARGGTRDRDVHPARRARRGRAACRGSWSRCGSRTAGPLEAADRVGVLAARRRQPRLLRLVGPPASTRSGSARARCVWSTRLDGEIDSSAAYAGGTVFVGDNSGTLTALDARTGAIRWQARSFSRFGAGREYFYATPTVAYGRVFASNTDGTVYAFGAGTGHLLWASHVGTYVYTAPAVWNQKRLRRHLRRQVLRPRRGDGRRRAGCGRCPRPSTARRR